jgi:hypothetical protein
MYLIQNNSNMTDDGAPRCECVSAIGLSGCVGAMRRCSNAASHWEDIVGMDWSGTDQWKAATVRRRVCESCYQMHVEARELHRQHDELIDDG